MKKYTILYFIFILILILFSCQKKYDDSQISGETRLAFRVGHIEKVSSANSKNTSGDESVQKVIDTIDIKGFEAVVSLVSEDIDNITSSNSSKFANTESIGDNIKYRVYIFKDSDNSFIGTFDGNSNGTDYYLDVQARTKYKWYAYSYNSSEPITDEIPSNFSENVLYSEAVHPSLADSLGSKQLLWASGEITTNAHNVETPVKITFKRKYSVIRLQFDGAGLTAYLRSATIKTVSNNLKQGVLNILTGDVSTSNSSVTILKDTNWVVSPDRYKIHTDFNVIVDTTSNMTFQAKLLGLQVTRLYKIGNSSSEINLGQLYDELSPKIGVMSLVIPGPSLPNNKMEMGKLYTLKVELLAPYSVKLGNAKWSIETIYYDHQLGHNAFRFDNPLHHISEAEQYKATDYYPHMSLTPTGAVNSGDPCSTIKPFNMWRMPTRDDCIAILTDPKLWTYTRTLGRVNDVYYGTVKGFPERVWEGLYLRKDEFLMAYLGSIDADNNYYTRDSVGYHMSTDPGWMYQMWQEELNGVRGMRPGITQRDATNHAKLMVRCVRD